MPRTKNSKSNDKIYFGDIEEQAIIDYKKCSDEKEKEKIFRNILYPALQKLVECIINKYKLYPADRDYEVMKQDALSYAVERVDRFDETKNCKAYSYFGTMIKHYCMGESNKARKMLIRSLPYEDTHDNDDTYDEQDTYHLENYVVYGDSEDDIINSIDEEPENYDDPDNEEMQNGYMLVSASDESVISKMEKRGGDDGSKFACEMLEEMKNHIKDMVAGKTGHELSKKEILVGKSLVNLFDNWPELFLMVGSKKFNKSAIFLYLRETTYLSTPDIRSCLKKFKNAYDDLKYQILNT